MSTDTVSMTFLSANLVLLLFVVVIFLSLFSSSISLVRSLVRCYCLVRPIKVAVNLFTFDRGRERQATREIKSNENWCLLLFSLANFICSWSNDVREPSKRVYNVHLPFFFVVVTYKFVSIGRQQWQEKSHANWTGFYMPLFQFRRDLALTKIVNLPFMQFVIFESIARGSLSVALFHWIW